jgi:hypothetical protein
MTETYRPVRRRQPRRNPVDINPTPTALHQRSGAWPRKTCSQCLVTKSREEFRAHQNGSGRLEPWCLACLRAWRMEREKATKSA